MLVAILTIVGLGHARFARAAKPGESLGRKYSSIERMTRAHLKTAHDDVAAIKAKRVEIPPLPGFNDYKSVLHAHAEDSAHTGGTRPEMLADAKRAGVSAILLTDHFRPPHDFIDESWRGLHEGVLFIPGSETNGFLIYPMHSIMGKMKSPEPELIKAVTEGEGLIFLSHVEERVTHSMEGLTGMEVYNRHADANDDRDSLIALMQMVTDPKSLAELQDLLKLYPDEMLAAQLDYMQLYLDKWDAESQKQKVSGVAANDCHHNQVFLVKMVDAETVLLGTIVDKDDKMRKVTAEARPGIRQMTKGHKPGDVLARLDFDPYYRSFLDEITHILAPELTEKAIRAALKAGHAYVSHDWMCDAKGFKFGYLKVGGSGGKVAIGGTKKDEESSIGGLARMPKTTGIMGDEVQMNAGDVVMLTASFPVECKSRLIKNGKLLQENTGSSVSIRAEEPGVYRLEGWLTVDGEERPWIYSNPVYVRGSAKGAK